MYSLEIINYINHGYFSSLLYFTKSIDCRFVFELATQRIYKKEIDSTIDCKSVPRVSVSRIEVHVQNFILSLCRS